MRAETYADVLLLLEDMRDHGLMALRFAEGRALSDLESDERHRCSVLYALQVVGEAASHVPQCVREMEQRIPWALIVGFRHVAVHGYGRVRLDKVQSILDEELRPLNAWVEDLRIRVAAKGTAPLPLPGRGGKP